jgi:hypothetical protein
MKNSRKIHLTVVSIINLIFIGTMIHAAWKGNDKAILLVLVGYPVLTLFNAFILFILRIFKRPESGIYKITTIALIALFIPVLLISSIH